jgi:glycosyltransferase involved in cell wall biosynthesis
MQVDFLPCVSVITVIKDPDERALDRTIESVRRQTYPCIEHILVDGGESGAGSRVRERYGSAVRLIAEPDQGIYDALNKGILRARGSFVVSLNVNDFLVEDAITAMVEHARAGPSGAITYCDYWFDEVPSHAPEVLDAAFEIYNMGVAHQAVMIPRELHLTTVGLYSTEFRIVSDHLWMREARRNGVRFRHLPMRLVDIDGHGLSSRKTEAASTLFESEAVLRLLMRFPFVPDSFARDLYRLRSTPSLLQDLVEWLSIGHTTEHESQPGWADFAKACAAYFEDVKRRCWP